MDDSGKYLLDTNGRPVYPIDPSTGNETYLTNGDGKKIFGVNKDGDQVYAKLKNLNEYFPDEKQFAVTKDDDVLYPLTEDGKVIFPKRLLRDKFQQDEYYLKKVDSEDDVFVMRGKMLDRYAIKFWLDDQYPTIVIDPIRKWKREIILNNEYALQQGKIPYYPIDEFGCEYLMELKAPIDENFYFPVGYPIANDSRIILPSYLDKAYISSTLLPHIKEEDIFLKVVRLMDTYTYYVTHIVKRRPSRSPWKFIPGVEDYSSDNPYKSDRTSTTHPPNISDNSISTDSVKIQPSPPIADNRTSTNTPQKLPLPNISNETHKENEPLEDVNKWWTIVLFIFLVLLVGIVFYFNNLKEIKPCEKEGIWNCR